MQLAVVKVGPKTAAQLSQLDALARVAPHRVPRVLGRWEDTPRGAAVAHRGYAMEMLEPFCMSTSLWPNVAWQCGQDLWSRDRVWRTICDSDWKAVLVSTLGIMPPDWAWKHDLRCATHGDMTMCNTMIRVLDSGDFDVVFVDPVYPERVPQIAVTDHARIVQTMLGWEIMTGFMHDPGDDFGWWPLPGFFHENETRLRVLAFWTYVVMARIEASRSVTEEERRWARHLRDELGRACL